MEFVHLPPQIKVSEGEKGSSAQSEAPTTKGMAVQEVNPARFSAKKARVVSRDGAIKDLILKQNRQHTKVRLKPGR